jgi:hypothetical protein
MTPAQQVAYRARLSRINVTLGQNAQPQQVREPARIVGIVGVL